MKVIGAGFGRTGTLSMKKALETLGFVKTHHMEEVFPSARQQKLWVEVAEGKPPQWDAIFDGFEACVDFPSASYYRELLEHFPDAKVLLTVRDFDKWYRSVNETIYPSSNAVPAWMQAVIPMARRMDIIVNGTVWDRLFGGKFLDKEHSRRVFGDYIEQVKHNVPADRLLVYEVGEGWEKLCTFLNVPVPDEPFPHVNDTAAFKRGLRIVRGLIWSIHIGLAAAVLALVWFLLG
ncbi:MAG: sulfotransferase [Blastomonas sp.]